MPSERESLIDVALGVAPPDRVIRGAKLVNVLTREIYPADVIIKGQRIASVTDPDRVASGGPEVIRADGKFLVPGFMDPHMHLESSSITVAELARAIVPRGVTSIMEDPHEIANVLGLKGIELLFREARQVPLNVFLRVPAKVPANPEIETAGAELDLQATRQLLSWKEAVCLAGDLNPALILAKDRSQMEKIEAAIDLRKVVSGQSPGLKDEALNAFIAAGPQDSHVSKDMDEVVDIMRHGMRALLTPRDVGFGVGDYAELAKAITSRGIDSRYVLMCTDDIPAHVLLKDGHLDHRLRLAISRGVEAIVAIQMATINVAEYFGLSRDFGSIAPGRFADIVILGDLSSIEVEGVLFHGKLVAEGGSLVAGMRRLNYPRWSRQTIHLRRGAKPEDFIMRSDSASGTVTARVLVPNVMPKKLELETLTVRDGEVFADPDRDILSAAVFERHRGTGNVGKAFVKNTGIKSGAVATTVNHDAHNILVVGTNHDDMAAAVNRLAEIGGGYVAIKDKMPVGEVPLPIAGLLSDRPVEVVARQLEEFEHVVRKELGFGEGNPTMALSFMCLPNIPDAGVTDRGLVDSRTMRVIDTIVKAEA